MKYKSFLTLIMTYKKVSEEISELYDIGVDLLEGKYKILEKVGDMLNEAMEVSYGEEGLDWVNWFIFENEYGQKDWSTAPLYSEDGKLIKEAGEVRHGAHDENGNPICYSYESLWEYLESNHKSK
jgi:hypothetical protein